MVTDRSEKVKDESSASEPAPNEPATISGDKRRIRKLIARYWAGIVILVIALLLWAPRLSGPINLRWDASTYYLLGTALAEGKGYRLLNEPGSYLARVIDAIGKKNGESASASVPPESAPAASTETPPSEAPPAASEPAASS